MSQKNYDLEIVAINDLGDAVINAHLLKFDTAHGRFGQEVSHDEEAIYIGDDKIVTLSERDRVLHGHRLTLTLYLNVLVSSQLKQLQVSTLKLAQRKY